MLEWLMRKWVSFRIRRELKLTGSFTVPEEIVPLTQAASVIIGYTHFKNKPLAEMNISVHFQELLEATKRPGPLTINPVVSHLMGAIKQSPTGHVAIVFSMLCELGDANIEEWKAFETFYANFKNPNQITLKV